MRFRVSDYLKESWWELVWERGCVLQRLKARYRERLLRFHWIINSLQECVVTLGWFSVEVQVAGIAWTLKVKAEYREKRK